MTQQEKYLIIDAANEKDFTLNINGKQYPARLAGYKLDFPFVYCVDETGKSIDAQISWELARKISTGQTNFVTA